MSGRGLIIREPGVHCHFFTNVVTFLLFLPPPSVSFVFPFNTTLLLRSRVQSIDSVLSLDTNKQVQSTLVDVFKLRTKTLSRMCRFRLFRRHNYPKFLCLFRGRQL